MKNGKPTNRAVLAFVGFEFPVFRFLFSIFPDRLT